MVVTSLSVEHLEKLRDSVSRLEPSKVELLGIEQIYQAITGIPYSPIWNPLPGPQSDAMASEADEIFYGGAAGGGKTDLLVGMCATGHHKRCLLLRRHSVDLTAAKDRLLTVMGTQGWKNVGGGGELRRGGRTIELKGCKDEKDKYQYQGQPHDLIMFDEVSQFTKAIYDFIIGWNRDAYGDMKQRCRVICAGNPPSEVEGSWVKEDAWAPWLDDTFPDPALPGELRWYTTDDDGRTLWLKSGDPVEVKGMWIKPRSRTFIPARLKDNPYLVKAGYEAVLARFPEPLRSQMLLGDMNAGDVDDEWQVIPTEWIRMAQRRWKDYTPDFDEVPLSAMGIDVARGGRDFGVIAKRYDNWFAKGIKFPGISIATGPKFAAQIIKEWEDGCTINLDALNVGYTIEDILRETIEIGVNAINVGRKTKMRDKTRKIPMVNYRAAIHWRMREALDPHTGDDIALPPCKELLVDLAAPRFELQTNGIKIEDKDDIKERIGRSPDYGDAVMLANWSGRRLWVA